MSIIGIGRRFLLDINPELLGPLQEFVDPSGHSGKYTAECHKPRCDLLKARDFGQFGEHASNGDENNRQQWKPATTPCRETVIGAVLDHVILGNNSLIGHDLSPFIQYLHSF